jgi:predicted nuclease with TOPRIM domain
MRPDPGGADLTKSTRDGLRSLESMVRRVQEKIRRLTEENGRLRRRVEELTAEKQEGAARIKLLQEEGKKAMMARGRNRVARTKVREIIRRIDEIETEGGVARSKEQETR